MSKVFFMPAGYYDRERWFYAFNEQFQLKFLNYGYTTNDAVEMANDYKAIKFSLDFDESVKNLAKGSTEFKKLIYIGEPSQNVLLPPDFTVLPTLTTPVAPGVIRRVEKIVQQMKKNKNYTTDDGKDFGIEGTTRVINYDDMQPAAVLKAAASNHNIIGFLKNGMDGVFIYGHTYLPGTAVPQNPGDEIAWTLLAKINHSPYIDIRLNSSHQPETRIYKIVYFVNDKAVGKESAILRVVTQIYVDQDGNELSGGVKTS